MFCFKKKSKKLAQTVAITAFIHFFFVLIGPCPMLIILNSKMHNRHPDPYPQNYSL